MIRPYTSADKAALLDILGHLTPGYFAPSEQTDYRAYLDQHAAQYSIVEEAGAVIAAGGVNYFPEHRTARLSWDMVHPDFQGKGIGRKLTLHRLEYIKKVTAIKQVVVRTTQLVYHFYLKIGFEIEKMEKDYWEKGFDLYQLSLRIQR